MQLLLSQYGSSKDVVVLTAMAGRPTVELEPLVGWFACGCAIRCSLEGVPSPPCLHTQKSWRPKAQAENACSNALGITLHG